MNRRNFIENILVAGASFMILPGAGRIWRAAAVVPNSIAYVDKDGNYHYMTREYWDQSWVFLKGFWGLQPVRSSDRGWEKHVRDVFADPTNRRLIPSPAPAPEVQSIFSPNPGPPIVWPKDQEYTCQIIDQRPYQAHIIHPRDP